MMMRHHNDMLHEYLCCRKKSQNRFYHPERLNQSILIFWIKFNKHSCIGNLGPNWLPSLSSLFILLFNILLVVHSELLLIFLQAYVDAMNKHLAVRGSSFRLILYLQATSFLAFLV